MGDKPASATRGELLKQMAAIHTQIDHLRYKPDSQSRTTELAKLKNELGRLNNIVFGPTINPASRYAPKGGQGKGPDT